ncbi:MAG: hypothetical protein EHM81_04965 [Chloroflexi bacterium]|nr:MAG: hypothetical protein EHM81_04965 [Chloroflexota bacterium]
MLDRNTLCYGSPAPLPEQIPLRAGPLHLLYENGSLRHLRYGREEVLLNVYVAVRDHNWGTVPGQLTLLKRELRAFQPGRMEVGSYPPNRCLAIH